MRNEMPGEMPEFDTTRATLEQYCVDMRQFVDFRQSTLATGPRIVEGYNGSGLTFTLLPDRGLDIWLAAYNGRPLTWISQNSPHAPDWGASWLRQFNGGVLVTCGLRHVGPPEADDRTGERRDLHGDFTKLRTANVTSRAGWQEDGFVAELTGVVADTSFFGEQLRLTRTYRMVLGEPWLEVIDVVENLFDTPAPFMLLHHFNFGYPLVQPGVTLHTASAAVLPRDLAAHSAQQRWALYEAATPRHQEEVFFHQIKVGADGVAVAALASADFGIQLEWDTSHEPYLTQWKNYRHGIYLCGVEPGNCLPEGQNQARRAGRLVQLQPGERHTFRNRLTVLPDATAVTAMRERIATLLDSGRPMAVALPGYEG